jgi:hypothetical protein
MVTLIGSRAHLVMYPTKSFANGAPDCLNYRQTDDSSNNLKKKFRSSNPTMILCDRTSPLVSLGRLQFAYSVEQWDLWTRMPWAQTKQNLQLALVSWALSFPETAHQVVNDSFATSFDERVTYFNSASVLFLVDAAFLGDQTIRRFERL